MEKLLDARMESARAREVAHHLTASGVWTHDLPLAADQQTALGLPGAGGRAGRGANA